MSGYSVEFSSPAKEDLIEIIKFYKKISEKLVQKFEMEFWTKIDLILENPEKYQKRYRVVRIALLNTFPFAIHFHIENNTVKVLKVFHTKRDY